MLFVVHKQFSMIVEIVIFIFTYLTIATVRWIINSQKTHRTFIKYNIPGPKPQFLVGNLIEFFKVTNRNELIETWIQKYGNYFGYYLGDRPFLIVTDLDVIQKVLITESKKFINRPKLALNAEPFIHSLIALEDDRWRHVRKMVTPAFGHQRVTSKEFTDLVASSADKFLDSIDKNQTHVIINVTQEMQRITMDTICKWAFDMETDVFDENNDFMKAVKEFLEFAENFAVEAAFVLPFLRIILTFINNHLTAGKMTDMAVKHLKWRIKSEIKGLKQQDKRKQNLLFSFINYMVEGKISENELIGNSLLILLGGFETSSNGLTFTLYLLAKHQEIQEKLRQDVNLDGYQSKYLEMVLNESFRVYPPVVTFVTRAAGEDTTIDDFFIPKGVTVQVPVWHVHHNERFWPEPDLFDPERFAPENKLPHPAAFLPFGLGPRNCIGAQFANRQLKIVISKIISAYKIVCCDKTQEKLEFKCPTAVIHPIKPVYLEFVPIC